jgi:hypothetical protein
MTAVLSVCTSMCSLLTPERLNGFYSYSVFKNVSIIRRSPVNMDIIVTTIGVFRVSTTNKKFWEELIAYFPLYEMGHIKNDASNNSSIVACVFVTAVTFLPSRCLATIRFLPSRCLETIGGFLPSRSLTTIRGLLPSRCLAHTHTAT